MDDSLKDEGVSEHVWVHNLNMLMKGEREEKRAALLFLLTSNSLLNLGSHDITFDKWQGKKTEERAIFFRQGCMYIERKETKVKKCTKRL